MNILIIKRDKIGDMLLTTPMLQHLRSALPEACIDVLANNYNAWVVERNCAISRLWIYPRARVGRRISFSAVMAQLWQTLLLRRQKYDVAIIAGGEESSRATRRALYVAAKRTIGFCVSDQCKRMLSDPVEVAADRHEAERMLSLLAPLGIQPPREPVYPHFTPAPPVMNFSRDWLGARNIDKHIVIGLGARRAKKQPSTEQILRWSQYFYEVLGLATVFMWTPGKKDNPLYPGDDDIAEPVLRANREFIFPVRGRLQDAIGLIWLARCSIFPDSGLMHFAAASPGGVLGLFADTQVSPSPARWAPLGPRARYLEATVRVADLADSQVFAEIESLLGLGLPGA